jgi:hypothetical protein
LTGGRTISSVLVDMVVVVKASIYIVRRMEMNAEASVECEWMDKRAWSLDEEN